MDKVAGSSYTSNVQGLHEKPDQHHQQKETVKVPLPAIQSELGSSSSSGICAECRQQQCACKTGDKLAGMSGGVESQQCKQCGCSPDKCKCGTADRDIGLQVAKTMSAAGSIETKKTGVLGLISQHVQYEPHPTEKMLACVWEGSKSAVIREVPRPKLSSPTDALVDITGTCICGSDLHLFNNKVKGMLKGDILGHEGIGIVREVGYAVKHVKPGDRVVISAVIACGACEFCKLGQFSLCDATNPSEEASDLYGHRPAGLLGFSSLNASYAGVQAEVARVPFADVNLLKINNNSLSDEQVILLSDILCTALHGLEMGLVKQTDTVCIWGGGPVGLLCAYLAKKLKHAYRVLLIDCIPHRLNVAKRLGCETFNFKEVDILQAIKAAVPAGPDVCIDCVGCRFPKSTVHKISMALGMDTDAVDTLHEAIMVCKKGGRISLVGEYVGMVNDYPVGAAMMKALTIRGGPVYIQKYWNQLLELIEKGEIDTTWLLSHRFNLNEIDKAYDIFNNHKDNCIKTYLYTTLGRQLMKERLPQQQM